MDKLMPLLWIAAIVLLYIGAGFWIITLRDMLRRGVHAVTAVALVIAAVALVGGFMGGAVAAPRLLAAAVIANAVLLLARVFGPATKPQYRKLRNEDTQQTYLHLVLLTGTVIFMVPFVWLISTSLKDDEDIFSTQIRLIPYRPLKQQFAGYPEPLDLVTVTSAKTLPNQEMHVQPDGTRVSVWAKIQDNEDTVTVAPVLAGNTLAPEKMKVNPDDVKKVKKVGALWENYPDSLKYLPEGTHHGLVYLGNTLLITGLSILGTLLTASMVAFAFARLRWPGRDALFVVLLSTMMLPGAVTMIPQFLIWQHLGFINTLVPLWIGAFFGGGAFNIFLLRQFFMTIPSELEEAARIDGCSYWRTYWTIMMPLVRPAMATVAIGTFMGSWNNFMGPLIYISSPTKMPVAYALQLYQTAHGGENGFLMAASAMVMLPVLVVFFFCQRYFIQGITLTGLKG